MEFEGRFLTVSPFFNMEERSLKKGYDVALFETAANEYCKKKSPDLSVSLYRHSRKTADRLFL